jgi:cytidylate kinase
MSVITISREFGSEGDHIAHQVAQTLGYHFVDRKIIGIILGQFGYVEFDKEYASLPTFWERFDAQRAKQRDVLVDMLNRVMQALAYHGNLVLLGRSGFEVLGGFSDTLHVRIQSPFPVRVRRVMSEQAIPYKQAEILVKQNDKVRLAFVEEFYKVPWGAVQAFDLAINTGKILPEQAIDMIVQATRTLATKVEIEKPWLASIEVDHILAETVSEVLQCQEVHRETVPLELN